MEIDYKIMKRSSCEHKRTIVGAIDLAVAQGNNLNMDERPLQMFGCAALQLAPQLYSGLARTYQNENNQQN